MLNCSLALLTADSKIQTERLDLKIGLLNSKRKQNLRLGKCSNYLSCKNETTEGVAKWLRKEVSMDLIRSQVLLSRQWRMIPKGGFRGNKLPLSSQALRHGTWSTSTCGTLVPAVWCHLTGRALVSVVWCHPSTGTCSGIGLARKFVEFLYTMEKMNFLASSLAHSAAVSGLPFQRAQTANFGDDH